MIFEQLLTCPCGHPLEDHRENGCAFHAGTSRCTCAYSHAGVVEHLIALEREAARFAWQSSPTTPAR